MREMCLEQGFNDFLAKPIDLSKLERILVHWLPPEKRLQIPKAPGENAPEGAPLGSGSPGGPPQGGTGFAVLGLNVGQGIARTGGTLGAYQQVLALFIKDAQERLPPLRQIPGQGRLQGFTTQVHALKSALASIGAEELSEKAARLEAAGKAGALPQIREELPPFVDALSALGAEIAAALKAAPPGGLPSEEAPLPEGFSGPGELTPLLEELYAALENRRAAETDRLLGELERKNLDLRTREELERIAGELLVSEFDRAAALVKALLPPQGPQGGTY
jgi:HPt (histidine-containing phosphotransfer) domain-containing protein